MNAVVVVSAIALNRYYAWQNKKADRGEVILEGDEHFRYQG